MEENSTHIYIQTIFFCRFQIYCLFVESQLSKSIIIYRHIQLLTAINNDIQQKTLLSLVISCAITIQALGMTSFVNLKWNYDNADGILIAAILVTAGLGLIMVFLSGVASIYKTSIKVVDRLTCQLAKSKFRLYTRREYQQRCILLRSCAPVKIRFGSINFVDQLTPLNCMEWANDVTVQLLLLKV